MYYSMKSNDLEAKVLFSLYRNGYIGGQHTAWENSCKGFPRAKCGKIKKIIRKLIKERYLIPKNAGYGLHISINPTRLNEIKDIMEELDDDLKSL